MLDGFEGNPDNRGILVLPEKEMQETASAAAELGMSIAIHAIGDRAARIALNSIEHAQRHLAGAHPGQAMPPLRHRREHAQLRAPEDLQRRRPLGVLRSLQPYHALADRDIAERYWGARCHLAY